MDQMDQLQKNKEQFEFHPEVQQEDPYIEEIKKNLDEQKKRFEDAKRAKQFEAEQKKLKKLEGRLQDKFADSYKEQQSSFEEKRRAKKEKQQEKIRKQKAQESIRDKYAVEETFDEAGEMDLAEGEKIVKEGGTMTELRQALTEERQQVKKAMPDDVRDTNIKVMDIEDRASRMKEKINSKHRKTATERLEENFGGYLNRDNVVVTYPDLKQMREDHKEKFRTRVIHHAIKPDEEVREKVVENKEEKTTLKAAYARKLQGEADYVTDAKVKNRAAVDIDAKKKMDYYSFTQLSEFSTYLSKEDMTTMTSLYGDGVRIDRQYNPLVEQRTALEKEIEKAKQTAAEKEEEPQTAELEKQLQEVNKKLTPIAEKREKDREKNLFPAMDMMTDVILKMDPGTFDLSSDQAIAENAKELEKMAGAVKSYRDLLEKNPDYLTHIMEKKGEKEVFGGRTIGGEVMKQLEKLTAISNYYRLRKLVITDDLYMSLANEEISMEKTGGDDIKTANLKKNMRLSYYAGVQLQRVFSGVNIQPVNFEENDLESTYLLQDKMTTIFSMSEDQGMVADNLRLIEQRNGLTDEAKKTLEKGYITGNSITEQAMDFLQSLGEQDRFVCRTTEEQRLIAPKEQYHMLSLDPKKQRTKPAAGKYTPYTVCVGQTADLPFATMAIKNAHRTYAFEKWKEMQVRKRKGKVWDANPGFPGGEDGYLGELEISDDWNRSSIAFFTEGTYRHTDEEVLEMYDILSITEDKEQWKKIKADPEQLAYYESAYKEMAMKHLSDAYATSVRTAQTIGLNCLLLHPVDFLMQATLEMRRIIMGNVASGNIITDSNNPRIEKLFAENNKDGHILFDMEDYKRMAGINLNVNMKLSCCKDLIMIYGAGDTGEAGEAVFEDLFQDADFYENKVKKEWLDYARRVEKTNPQKAEEMREENEKAIAVWYFSQHPELFSTEMLLKKNTGGNLIFEEGLYDGAYQAINGAEEDIQAVLEKKRVPLPSADEIKAYEDSLKERNMPILRKKKTPKEVESTIRINRSDLRNNSKEYQELKEKKAPTKNDIERMAYLEKNMRRKEEILVRLEDIKKKQKAINPLIERDPYGLHVIMGGFKEFYYKDTHTGTQKMAEAKYLY